MANPLPPESLAAVRAALAAGNKIEAIKLHREATGLGLAEAKEAVEQLERGLTPSAATPAPAGAALPAVRAALAAGKKIEAVKLYREAMGVGLKDAKDAVDRMEAERGGLPTNAPVKSGCFGMLFAVVLPRGALAAWWLVR